MSLVQWNVRLGGRVVWGLGVGGGVIVDTSVVV